MTGDYSFIINKDCNMKLFTLSDLKGLTAIWLKERNSVNTRNTLKDERKKSFLNVLSE